MVALIVKYLLKIILEPFTTKFDMLYPMQCHSDTFKLHVGWPKCPLYVIYPSFTHPHPVLNLLRLFFCEK